MPILEKGAPPSKVLVVMLGIINNLVVSLFLKVNLKTSCRAVISSQVHSHDPLRALYSILKIQKNSVAYNLIS